MNFWIPSDTKTAPTTSRTRIVARGALVASSFAIQRRIPIAGILPGFWLTAADQRRYGPPSAAGGRAGLAPASGAAQLAGAKSKRSNTSPCESRASPVAPSRVTVTAR